MNGIQNILVVGLGGFIGSILRYVIGGLLQRLTSAGLFPLGTLGVNVIGCLAIGLLAGWAESRQVLTSPMRLFLLIGLLGGFTTFSSFGLETMEMLRDGQLLLALTNVGLQVVVGLTAVWLGFSISTVT